MSIRFFTLFVFITRAFVLFSQDEPSKYDLAPCGTLPFNDHWLQAYQANPPALPENADDTLYVGMQVHLLANNNGSGRFTPERMLDALCQLNTDYGPAAVRFYFKHNWHLVNNTAWFSHDSTVQGVQMMFANNVPDALNAYFVVKAAGNCGYNLPYAGVAMAHSCVNPGDHTWSHEVGHALRLPHPFIGWEGKTYNPNNQTPDTLTYNYTHFHSTPDTIVPAPPDTALVEYVDGSNCGIAADRICDTKPDYLSYRWDCNAQNNSFVEQKDPAGAPFFSDGSLYMSYSYDHCQSRFSPEEIQVMRTSLLTEKADWVVFDPPNPEITGVPVLLSPVNDQPVPATGALLQWAPVAGATHYVVQASRLSTFGLKEVEAMVADTFFTTGPLTPNLSYYWRVRAFNYSHTCTAFSSGQKFKPVTVSSSGEPGLASWRCYPTLLRTGQSLHLDLPESWINQNGRLAVYDATGRMRWQLELNFDSGQIQAAIPSELWSSGVYFLSCSGPGGIAHQTLFIQSE